MIGRDDSARLHNQGIGASLLRAEVSRIIDSDSDHRRNKHSRYCTSIDTYITSELYTHSVRTARIFKVCPEA